MHLHYALADLWIKPLFPNSFSTESSAIQLYQLFSAFAGLKMHDMKEGFSMEMEGREKSLQQGRNWAASLFLELLFLNSCANDCEQLQGWVLPQSTTLSQHTNKTYTMCFPEAFSEVSTPYKLRLSSKLLLGEGEEYTKAAL